MAYTKGIILLKPLLKVCNAAAISPLNPFENYKDKSKLKLYNYYALSLIATFTLLYIYCEYKRFLVVYPSMVLPVVLTTMVNYFSLLLMNVVTITMTTFWHNDTFTTLLITLKDTEEVLRLRHSFITKHATLVTYVYVLLIGGPLVFGAYVWPSSVSWYVYRYYLPGEFQYLHFSLTLYLLSCLATSVYLKFSRLNEYVLETMDKYVKTTDKHIYHVQSRVKHIRKMYDVLSDAIIKINNIFGYIIVCVIVVTITTLLRYIMFLFVYAITQKKLGPVSFDGRLLILSLFWSVSSLVSTKI